MSADDRRLPLDAALWNSARAPWPTIEVARDAFAAYLRDRSDVASEHVADLYLACACSNGDERAIAAFRERYGAALRHAVRKAAPAELADEVVQRVLTKLFVTDGERAPGIARYEGRGKLSTWIQVVARREASNTQRTERQHQPDSRRESEWLLQRAVLAEDAELASLKDRFRSAFKLAFADALGELSARERNLLRYECIEQLTREQIAQLYGVSVKTVARWRTACRKRINRRTRECFAARAGVNDEELDSAMRLIESQLEVSLSRLLPLRSR